MLLDLVGGPVDHLCGSRSWPERDSPSATVRVIKAFTCLVLDPGLSGAREYLGK